MQQSNGYIIGFAAVMTLVLGGLLSFAAVQLKPLQVKEAALDKKKQILGAVMSTEGISKEELADIYEKRIQSINVSKQGDELNTDIAPEDVVVGKEFKKPEDKRVYPVFKYMAEGSADKVEAYILPVYGNGLWDNIWGFIAVSNDKNTVLGAVFDHKGETPGLGARITDADIQQRYKGKKIYDASGALKSITMLKGENHPESDLNDYSVDGMSGATITGNGVTDMLTNYFGLYEGYLKSAK